MQATIRTLIEICVFRAGPQELPYSAHLLGVCLALSAVLSFLGAQQLRPGDPIALEVAVVTGFTAAFVYGLLSIQRLQSRFMQTATAVFGSNVVLALPVFVLSMPVAEHGPEDAGAALLGLLALVIWHVGILGHIFRHALSSSLGLGVLIAIVYYLLSTQLSHLVG